MLEGSSTDTIQVDFGQVAQECKIVSKGAAYVLHPLHYHLLIRSLCGELKQQLRYLLVYSAKRYERMMRSHGIAPNAATIKPASSRTPKSERRDSKSHTTKKRKASAFIEENTAVDDEENFSRVKPDPANEKEQLNVKEESGQLSLDEAANLMQYYGTSSYSAQLGGEETFSNSEYGSNTTGYNTGIGASYGLPDQQPYDFSFSPAAMDNGPTSLAHGIQYQQMMHYPSTGNQGGSESPLVVD